MTSVNAPTPDKMDEIDGLSIVSMEKTSTNAVFRNRDGEIVGDLVIRTGDVDFVKAIGRIGSYDTDYRDVLIKGWSSPGIDNNRTYQFLGSGYYGVRCATWSPDAKYLAVVGEISTPHNPNVMMYKRVGNNFSEITFPYLDTDARTAAWSPDGQYLAVTGISNSSVSSLYIYKRSGDTFTETPKLPGLPDLTYDYYTATWSPDGQYLAFGTGQAPFLWIYKRSGDTFTKIANPNVMPGEPVGFMQWSPDGQYLAASSLQSVGDYGFYVYKQNGDGFSRVTLPDPPGMVVSALGWSPDNEYLALGLVYSPFFVCYRRSGDSFTRMPLPNVPPQAYVFSASWSPDSNYLAVGIPGVDVITNALVPGVSYMEIYKLVDGELVQIPYMQSSPTQVFNVEFAPDGSHLAVGTFDTQRDGSYAGPYLSIYKSAQAPIPGIPIRIAP